MVSLHLGSGTVHKENFINVDIQDLPGVDLVADVTLPLPGISAGSADRVEAYDVLEHFPYSQTTDVLLLWVSYLQPGGRIVIRVPDLECIAKELFHRTLPLQTAQHLILGGQQNEWDYHKAGFDGSYLEGLLIGCGCSKILQRIHENHNVTVVAEK